MLQLAKLLDKRTVLCQIVELDQLSTRAKEHQKWLNAELEVGAWGGRRGLGFEEELILHPLVDLSY